MISSDFFDFIDKQSFYLSTVVYSEGSIVFLYKNKHHLKSKTGRIFFACCQYKMHTFPVVRPCNLNISLISCSPAAPILSILLPNSNIGQLASCSSANNDSNSMQDSLNLGLSHTSIKNTIASTAGK